jgi:hypothetical protein
VDSILSISQDSKTSRPLDELYMKILLQIFGGGPVPQRYKTVMSHVLAAFEPLSMESLDSLLVSNQAVKSGEVNMVIGQLGALLSGTDGSGRVVRPLHISFYDFLLDKSCSYQFTVEPSSTQHVSFLEGSLRILNEQLAFNMCGMETSYKLNSDYGNLKSNLTEKKSAALVYAALYWGKHLSKIYAHAPDNIDWVISIKSLLEKKGLFWIEALSLLKAIRTGSSTLATVVKYCQSIPSSEVCMYM